MRRYYRQCARRIVAFGAELDELRASGLPARRGRAEGLRQGFGGTRGLLDLVMGEAAEEQVVATGEARFHQTSLGVAQTEG